MSLSPSDLPYERVEMHWSFSSKLMLKPVLLDVDFNVTEVMLPSCDATVKERLVWKE